MLPPPSKSEKVQTAASSDNEIHALKIVIDEKDFEIQKLKREVVKANEEKELELRQLKRASDKTLIERENEIKMLRAKSAAALQELSMMSKQIGNYKKLEIDLQRANAETQSLRKRLADLQKDYDSYLQKINSLRQSDDSIRAQLQTQVAELQRQLKIRGNEPESMAETVEASNPGPAEPVYTFTYSKGKEK